MPRADPVVTTWVAFMVVVSPVFGTTVQTPLVEGDLSLAVAKPTRPPQKQFCRCPMTVLILIMMMTTLMTTMLMTI